MGTDAKTLVDSMQAASLLVWVIRAERVSQVTTQRGAVLIHLTDWGEAVRVADKLDLSKITDYPDATGEPFTTYQGICQGVTVTVFGALREATP